MTSVQPSQRHSRQHPCPICGGKDGDRRGNGRRCHGFSSADGEWVHCAREEFAGALSPNDNGLFTHRMAGPCNCGQQHGRAREQRSGAAEPEAVYPYRDESGQALFEVVRFPGKQFRQRRMNGHGAYAWGIGDTRRVLYRLPELLEASSDRPVFVVEGEKDVDCLLRRGLVATCNPHGAGKWSRVAEQASSVLKGRDVVVISDRDEAGRRHAQDVAASLGCARSLRVVEFDQAKDASEFFLTGGTVEELNRLVEASPKLGPKDTRKEKWLDWSVLAMADLAPMPWIAEDLQLGPGRPCGLWGYGGSGKSWIAQALGVSVAAGVKFLDRFPVRQGRVAHISYELGMRAIAKRYRRLANGLLIEPSQIEDRLVALVHPSVYLNSQHAEAWLRHELMGIDFCIIDSLRRALPGADENDSAISNYLDVLSRISDSMGITFLVIHHSGKQAIARSDTQARTHSSGQKEERGAGRGSSAIEDASGSVWKIEGGHNGPRKLVMSRTHEDAEDFAKTFHVHLQPVARDEPLYQVDGKPAVRILCLDESEVDSIERAGRRKGNLEKWKAACRDIVNCVEKAGRCTWRQVLRETADSRSQRAAIEDLVAANVLVESNEGKGRSRWLSLGPKSVESFLEPDQILNTEGWFPNETDDAA